MKLEDSYYNSVKEQLQLKKKKTSKMCQMQKEQIVASNREGICLISYNFLI